jgi:hypothetical protein
VIPERILALVKYLKILFAPSIGYFNFAFERFLKLGYTLCLVFEILSVVYFFCINQRGEPLINFENEAALLVELAPNILSEVQLALRFYPMNRPLRVLPFELIIRWIIFCLNGKAVQFVLCVLC